VQHYDLDSRYATSAPSQGVDGTVTLLARATQSLRAWLYDAKTPPMPGHPDWTVDSVDAAARTQTLSAPWDLRVLPKR